MIGCANSVSKKILERVFQKNKSVNILFAEKYSNISDSNEFAFIGIIFVKFGMS
jgi:hypothetical protein